MRLRGPEPGPKPPVAGLWPYLEQTSGNAKQSAVLTEKLADLYAAQGKPVLGHHAYEQALELDPSPQQRVRLRLTLGEKLTASDRNADAYENSRRCSKKGRIIPTNPPF